MAITQQDRMEWAHSPVTQELLAELRGSKQETMEAWASEVFIGVNAEETSVKNATALGGVRVLTDLIGRIEDYQSYVDDSVDMIEGEPK